ncbi:hypothetical protein TEA_007211 [Camellia sinensis var. sinensis]|uniref:Uncharacterized protein n=1 Tax=Camellia sinensis var. sinensis TaxID=542762 RepID=A0A4S4ETD7_CAMSN|nr:hypothetical protein TEA_007211 [Camellia sinensis var. sinensis]
MLLVLMAYLGPYHNSVFTRVSEFALTVLMMLLASEDYMNQGAALLEDVKAYNYILRKDDAPASLDGVNLVTDTVSRLDVSAVPDSNPKPTAEQIPILGIVECKCGMPLCICEAPVPFRDAVTLPNKSTTTSTAQSNPKPKKTDTSLKNRGSTSNNKQLYDSAVSGLHFLVRLVIFFLVAGGCGLWSPNLSALVICTCTTFNLGQVTTSSLEKSQMDYEVNGEGLREAIKNGDTLAVKELLSKQLLPKQSSLLPKQFQCFDQLRAQLIKAVKAVIALAGVDANYCDKQGLSLLHLAALFNRTDIAFALMEYGASLDHRNLQGETPLDCAPATLQNKMRKKMEESEHLSPHHII